MARGHIPPGLPTTPAMEPAARTGERDVEKVNCGAIRTHDTSSSQDPRGRLWVRAKDLLTLVVCPEATETVAHLSHPST